MDMLHFVIYAHVVSFIFHHGVSEMRFNRNLMTHHADFQPLHCCCSYPYEVTTA